LPAEKRFQSTLPSRGATDPVISDAMFYFHFNPRSPRGERLSSKSRMRPCASFQSTLPSRGATVIQHILVGKFNISIHAPLAGSDFGIAVDRRGKDEFQSTLPSRGATPLL